MYAERISSSIATSRIVPACSFAMARFSLLLAQVRWADLSRLSLFTACTSRRELDGHAVPLLQLALFGRGGAQEPTIGPRDQAITLAANFAVHLVDPSLAAFDAGLCDEQLARICRCAIAQMHLRGHRPGVVAGWSPGHDLVEQRGQDPTVDLVLPTDVVGPGAPFGASSAIAELDLQAHPDRVLAATGETVVVCKGVASPVAALDDPAGPAFLPLGCSTLSSRVPDCRAHQRSSSSSCQPSPSSSSRLGRRQ